jgi:hypothetical protein
MTFPPFSCRWFCSPIRSLQDTKARNVTTAIKLLRAALAMRRVMRCIALGKRANYYLKGA